MLNRMKIEELVQLEAEQRLDELRSIRNELAMLHRAIMGMQTKSTTTEQMIALLMGEIRDLKKLIPTKSAAVVMKESSCNTEVFVKVDASTSSGITLSNASTTTEEVRKKSVALDVRPTQVNVGVKTDVMEIKDAVVDMGITTVDVCTMVIPSVRDVDVSAVPRMKNVSTNTVVEVRHRPSTQSNAEVQKRRPSLISQYGAYCNAPEKSTKSAATSFSPVYAASEYPNEKYGQGKDQAFDSYEAQESRKRRLSGGIAAVEPKRSPNNEEQRMKIIEKIKTFERFIGKIKRRSFAEGISPVPVNVQCIFCGRNDHFNDNCPVVRSATARLSCAQRMQICLQCLNESCDGGPSCPGKDVPCVYCVGFDVVNSKTHHRSFCVRPEHYDQFKKQLDDLHEKLKELDRQ